MQDWKPGDKCRVCGCEVTIAAIAGEDVWCRDANGQHYTHALDDLRPLAPAAPGPETCGCEETPDTPPKSKLDRLEESYERVMALTGQLVVTKTSVQAAMQSFRDRARNLLEELDGHATPPAPALVPDEVRERAVECVAQWSSRVNTDLDHRTRYVTLGHCEKLIDALSSAGLLAGGDEAKLRAEVERLRAALPTEEEILAMRYLKGYAHLCDTPEVETFRAYLARTEAQA